MGVNFRRGNAGAGFISGAGETELQLQRRRFITLDYILCYLYGGGFSSYVPLTASGSFLAYEVKEVIFHYFICLTSLSC